MCSRISFDPSTRSASLKRFASSAHFMKTTEKSMTPLAAYGHLHCVLAEMDNVWSTKGMRLTRAQLAVWRRRLGLCRDAVYDQAAQAELAPHLKTWTSIHDRAENYDMGLWDLAEAAKKWGSIALGASQAWRASAATTWSTPEGLRRRRAEHHCPGSRGTPGG
jgi:hypothetical protein